MAINSTLWQKILKVAIAVLSAIAGAIGGATLTCFCAMAFLPSVHSNLAAI